MILKRRSLGTFARLLLLAAITCSLCCSYSPSLADRINATASRLKTWQEGKPFPKEYEKEVIGLAKKPTEALDEPFLWLEAQRSRERRARQAKDRVGRI